MNRIDRMKQIFRGVIRHESIVTVPRPGVVLNRKPIIVLSA